MSSCRTQVVRPQFAEVLCAWEKDGKTNERYCTAGSPRGCVTGCVRTSGPDWARGAEWCPLPDDCRSAVDCREHWCPFRPRHLKQMLERHVRTKGDYGVRRYWCGVGTCRYNEVVLDSGAWERALPHTVEAVFVPSGARPQDVARAKDLLASFQQAFHPHAVPLLMLDLSSPQAPFSAM